jgi:hypothetical protein
MSDFDLGIVAGFLIALFTVALIHVMFPPTRRRKREPPK